MKCNHHNHANEDYRVGINLCYNCSSPDHKARDYSKRCKKEGSKGVMLTRNQLSYSEGKVSHVRKVYVMTKKEASNSSIVINDTLFLNNQMLICFV